MKIQKIIRIPKMMLWAFIMEGMETRNMIQTFAAKGKELLMVSTTSGGPSKEELHKAVQQLKVLPKLLPFFIFIVVPVPGITEGYVLLALTLEKFLGHKVSLLPGSFSKIFRRQEETPSMPRSVQAEGFGMV